jgi:hypothetical protein
VVFHPHDRLERPLLGQGLGRVRPEMVKLFQRRKRESRRLVQVSEPRKHRGSEVRSLSPQIEATPNAPQLIRLIRHPYRLDQGTFVRAKACDRGMVWREARASYRLVLEETLHAPRRVAGFRPMRERKKLDGRIRPSIDIWISQREVK